MRVRGRPKGALLHNQAVAKLDEQCNTYVRRALDTTHGLDPRRTRLSPSAGWPQC